MKRLIFVLLVVGLAAGAVAQETIVMPGSNQNQTTLGFEMNEYDYLLSPLYLGALTNRWLFFALDNDVNQLGANIAGDGFRLGWAPGGEMTPVLLANYMTNIQNLDKSAAADNVEITRSGYDIATGLYATITQSVSEDTIRKQQVHDLVLHGGLTLTDSLALALQLAVALDRWSVASTDYTNTYGNTAAASDASLTNRGDLTETAITMRSASDNSYRMDIEAGLNLGNIQSHVVLGAGWYNPHSANNAYTETVTVYDAGGGLDDTVRDQEIITGYSGQYTTAGGVPSPSFSMAGGGVVWEEYFRLALDSDTWLPLGDGPEFSVPLRLTLDLRPADLQTIESNTTVLYDDASATSLESVRDATTITTSLSNSLDLTVSTGAQIGTSVMPAENTEFHMGASLDFFYSSMKETLTQVQQRNYQADNDGDGLYTTAGTDVSFIYSESGYEVQNSTSRFTGTLMVETAVSYTPVPVLTFHAGASAGLATNVSSTTSLTSGDAGFVYEQYTDNLDAANTYAQRQKDGSAFDTIPSAIVRWDLVPITDAEFGFTLNFSDNFKVDARSVYSGNVGFSEFSVLGMYSY